ARYVNGDQRCSGPITLKCSNNVATSTRRWKFSKKKKEDAYQFPNMENNKQGGGTMAKLSRFQTCHMRFFICTSAGRHSEGFGRLCLAKWAGVKAGAWDEAEAAARVYIII
nr:hypothetical protein [Tanacetum cinerariifolium]